MGESRPDYRGILNESEILDKKEKKAYDLKKYSPAVNENVTKETREIGQELQARVKTLFDLYQTKYNFSTKNLISDNTVESLTACLEPQRAEYVLAHLKELDALAARAEYEGRLLLKAEKAIETWEKLAGALPDDLVEDGLRVDAYAIMNLKRYIENLKNPVITTVNPDSSKEILEKLRRNNPTLISIVEGLESFEVEEE